MNEYEALKWHGHGPCTVFESINVKLNVQYWKTNPSTCTHVPHYIPPTLYAFIFNNQHYPQEMCSISN